MWLPGYIFDLSCLTSYGTKFWTTIKTIDLIELSDSEFFPSNTYDEVVNPLDGTLYGFV